MGRSQETGGVSKQPVNKAHLAKLKEASVGSKPITDFFGRKSPKRRVGRPNKKSSSDNKDKEEMSKELMTKRYRRGSKYSNSAANSNSSKSLKASKSKSSKAKTKIKVNKSLSYAYKNNEKKKKRTKWSAEYLRKVQVCWDDKTDLAVD